MVAGDKAQEQKYVTKAQAGNTADHAAVKADEAQAGVEQKKDDAKWQASAAGVRPPALAQLIVCPAWTCSFIPCNAPDRPN